VLLEKEDAMTTVSLHSPAIPVKKHRIGKLVTINKSGHRYHGHDGIVKAIVPKGNLMHVVYSAEGFYLGT
jgi:hypothetical protein